MTTGTQKTKAVGSSIPTLSNRPWTLRLTAVEFPPGLEGFNSLTITRQERNLDTHSISGTVTDAVQASFYPLNGQIDSKLAVNFFVTSGDSVYFFKGTVQPDAEIMEGSFKLVPPDDENEDGNWSAQAQGGGEDDDRPNPKPRHRRSR